MENTFMAQTELLKAEIAILQGENRDMKLTIKMLQTTTGRLVNPTGETDRPISSQAIAPKTSSHKDSRPPKTYSIGVKISNRFESLQESPAHQNNAPNTQTHKVTHFDTDSCAPQEPNDSQPWLKVSKKGKQKTPSSTSRSHLIIGDSLLKGVYVERMCTGNDDIVTVLPFPGAGFSRLLQKVQNFDVNLDVKKTTIHIGINDVMNGSKISTGSISDLTSCIKRKCPNALVAFSSIIPPRYGHQRPMVEEGNQLIRSYCEKNNMIFIDNTPFFTTSSGAPKKNMYYNQIHTSTIGTSILAKNIKYPERTLDNKAPARAPRLLNSRNSSQQNTHTSAPYIHQSRHHNLIAANRPPLAPTTTGKSTAAKPLISLQHKDSSYKDEFPPLPSTNPQSGLTSSNHPARPHQSSYSDPSRAASDGSVSYNVPPTSFSDSRRAPTGGSVSYNVPPIHQEQRHQWYPEMAYLRCFSPDALMQAYMMSVHKNSFTSSRDTHFDMR
jgi:hypothetical protein